MENSILTTLVLPASLFIIMIGMGLSLTLTDFRRVVSFPKAVGIGLVNQLLLLPLICLCLVLIFKLPPELSVGMLLLSACPGGATSNLITFVSKGDVALSVTLTAITSILTVFTIPLIVNAATFQFLSASQQIALPLLETMGKVFLITAFPVSLGMLIRYRWSAFALRMLNPAKILSTIIFVLILLSIVVANFDTLLTSFTKLGAITFLLNGATMGLGYAIACYFKLNQTQTISIAIESGIQNGTLAIVIASTILMQNEMGLPAAIYSVAMFLSGGAMMWYFGRGKQIPSD